MAGWSPMDLLPGLWLAGLAWLLDRLLRRWFDPVPWRVWGLFSLLLLLHFAPVLVGGRLLLPLDSLRGETPFRGLAPTDPHGNLIQGDLIQLVAPSRQLVGEALRDGRWPLWNDRAGAGMPLIADPQAQVLQPLAAVALPFEVARGAGVTAAARVLLALVFTFLLLRRQGLAEGPALLGAVAWGSGGFVLLWLGWPLANLGGWLPAVLYGVVRCDGGGRRDRLLLAAALAGLLVAGHPETVLYALALSGLFLLARLRAASEPRRLFAAAGLAGALALALTAPVWLPSAIYLPQTLRYHVIESGAPSFETGRVVAAEARLAQSLLPVVAPNAFGNSRYGRYWGRDNTNEDASGFPGTLTLLLACLALPGIGDRRRPGEGVMLVAAAGTLTWLALPPLVTGLLAAVPVVGGAAREGSHRPLLVLGFALAYLAACSLDRWRSGEIRRSWLFVPLVLLAALVAWAYLGHADPADATALEVLRLGWLRWQGRFLALGAVVLFFGFRRRWAPPAIALFVAAELFLAFHDANPPMPPRLDFPTPAPLAELEARTGADGGRIVALGSALPPNLASLYGLADARVYNPVEPATYSGLLGPLLATPRKNVPELVVADHPVLDLLGVGWVLTDPGVELGAPLERVVEDPAGWIYRRPRPLPRFFLPVAAQVLDTSGDDPFAAVDFAALAALPPGAEGVPWSATDPGGSSLAKIEIAPAHLSARARLAETRLLVASVYRQPGDAWRFLLDGAPLPTFEADGPLAAAWLPAGNHRLDLLYRPPGFVLGCFLAALGVLGVALSAPVPRRG
ncbi:MAG: hypothetical protein KDD11_07080 [Acidobacteria bacterium]|nr:hypothetical protein [Acidobacteriota bacterium]